MLLALLTVAEAACVVAQTRDESGIIFDIAMDGSCPVVSLIPDRPAELRAYLVIDGFPRRLPKDAIIAAPWLFPQLGWRINAPLLTTGDSLRLELTVPGEPHVDLLLDGSAPRLARGALVETTLELDAPTRRPQYAFTDPKHGAWRTSSTWTFGPDGQRGFLDAPSPDGSAWWPGGSGTVQTSGRISPARARLHADLPPGSLTIASPRVTLTPAGPYSGRLDTRVLTLDGIPILPDETALVAGLDAHFRAVSLPEPSVPMRLRGNLDKNAVVQGLWAAVREPARGQLGPVGRPRMLNRAWRSGWLTDEERALVLLRFLGQERIGARWVLTGPQADTESFGGFERLVVAAQIGGQVVWFDPACAPCQLGQFDPELSGAPAVGGADQMPRLPGRLDLVVSLSDAGVTTTVITTERASDWLRALDLPAVAQRIGLGSYDDVVRTDVEGELRITFTSSDPPRPVRLPSFAG